MDTYILDRLNKLRTEMSEKGLDAVLVTKKENYTWLSGFNGSSAWLVITAEAAVLTTDFRYEEQAARQAPIYSINIYQGNVLNVLKEVLNGLGVKKLGFEDNHVTYEQYAEYLGKFAPCGLVPLGAAIQELREVKDPGEIALISRAVAIADETFKYILGFIKPGMAEVEVAAEMEYFMRKQGASGPSFDTILASGERSSMPHGVASTRKIAMGDAVTMDFGALYCDYCSDMTRTVFVGQPTDELKKIYGIVLEAQTSAEAMIKAGLYGREVDTVARDIIAGSGYGENFGHGLGHGVGLEIHEEPRLSLTGNKKLLKNMVVTVEPGIYISGIGGVRIEDMVVVGDDGVTILTKSPKELIVL